MLRPHLLALLALALAPPLSAAELHSAQVDGGKVSGCSLAVIFGDHMVLQRDAPVPIWGQATPGETVTVEFSAQKKTTRASASGAWEVTLNPLKASAKARTLVVRSGAGNVTLSDILIGDVWLCSGQSNMEYVLGYGFRPPPPPTTARPQEILQAQRPQFRLFQVPHRGKPNPNVLGLRWTATTPESVQATAFSAVAYYFGSELQQRLNVPIGLIESSYNGTAIEPWTPGSPAPELYTTMIAPLAPCALRGFVWYQGESNCIAGDTAAYTAKLSTLITGWRNAWRQPQLPFYFVQIAPFSYSQRYSTPARRLNPESLPRFWEAQTKGLAVPGTAMVLTTDLVADCRDIHPPEKRRVGLRLANLVLARTYGLKGDEPESPRFVSAQFRADGKVEIAFTHTGTGLIREGYRPEDDFVIAGEDRRFVPAEFSIDGAKVVVWSPRVPRPIAVRFAWNETAQPDLVNSSGLPANSFRTDDWPAPASAP